MVTVKTSIFDSLPIRLKAYLRDFRDSKRITYHFHFKDKKLDEFTLDELKALIDLATKLDLACLDNYLFQ